MLFDKICRHNGITHRLTAPASPNQNGKVERFHGTFRPRLPRHCGPVHLCPAGAGRGGQLRRRVQHRPAAPGARREGAGHPAERFAPVPASQQNLIRLWLRRSWRAHPLPGASLLSHALPAQCPRPIRRPSRQHAERGPVRPGGAAVGEHVGHQPAVLVAPTGRGDRPDLGRLRPDPRPGRRDPDQHRPLPPVRQRPGPAHRPGSSPRWSLRCRRRRTATPSRWTAACPAPAWSAWPGSSWTPRNPRRPPVAIRIEGRTLMFFDPATRELLRTRPTRSPQSRPRACAAPAPPGRRHARPPSRSGSSAGPATPA